MGVNDASSGFDGLDASSLAAQVAGSDQRAAAANRLRECTSQPCPPTVAQAELPARPDYTHRLSPAQLQAAKEAEERNREAQDRAHGGVSLKPGEVPFPTIPRGIANTIDCENVLRKEGVKTQAELGEVAAKCPQLVNKGPVNDPSVLLTGPGLADMNRQQFDADLDYRLRQNAEARASLVRLHNSDLIDPDGYFRDSIGSQYGPGALGGLLGSLPKWMPENIWKIPTDKIARNFLPGYSYLRNGVNTSNLEARDRAATIQRNLDATQKVEARILDRFALNDTVEDRNRLVSVLETSEHPDAVTRNAERARAAQIRAEYNAFPSTDPVARDLEWRRLTDPLLTEGRAAAIAYTNGLGKPIMPTADHSYSATILESRQNAINTLAPITPKGIPDEITAVSQRYVSMPKNLKDVFKEGETYDLNEHFVKVRALSRGSLSEAASGAFRGAAYSTLITMGMTEVDHLYNGTSPNHGPGEAFNSIAAVPVAAGIFASPGQSWRNRLVTAISIPTFYGLGKLYDREFPTDKDHYSATPAFEATALGNTLTAAAVTMPLPEIKWLPDIKYLGGRSVLAKIGFVAGTIALTQAKNIYDRATEHRIKPDEVDALAKTQADGEQRTSSSFDDAVKSWVNLGTWRPSMVRQKMQDFEQSVEQQQARTARPGGALIAARQDAITDFAYGKLILEEKGTPLARLVDSNFQDPNQAGWGLDWNPLHLLRKDDQIEVQENAEYILPGSKLDIGGSAMAGLRLAQADINKLEQATKELDGKSVNGKTVDANAETQALQPIKDEIQTELDKIYAPHPDIEPVVQRLKELIGSSSGRKDLNDLGINIGKAKDAMLDAKRTDDQAIARGQAIARDQYLERNRDIAKLSRDLAMIRLAQSEDNLPADPAAARTALIAPDDSVLTYLHLAKELDPNQLGDEKAIARLAYQANEKLIPAFNTYIANNPGDLFFKVNPPDRAPLSVNAFQDLL
jgi:hypothetical protein